MNTANHSRRDFLRLAGMGTAAMTLPGFRFQRGPGEYRAKTGLQPDTVRDAIISTPPCFFEIDTYWARTPRELWPTSGEGLPSFI